MWVGGASGGDACSPVRSGVLRCVHVFVFMIWHSAKRERERDSITVLLQFHKLHKLHNTRRFWGGLIERFANTENNSLLCVMY